MLCPGCHSSNEDGVTFCTNCGLKMAAAGQEPAASNKADELSAVYNLWSSDASRRESSLTGKTIDGKYQLESQIGKGGMGTVFRARRLLIGDTVAIKILHLTEDADPHTTERFRREAQAAARLKHPNAVSIYDFGISTDGLQYLVMELVEGESLRALIKRSGPVAPVSSAEILSQTCSALDEAHRQGIIHRDIKPDNIFISTTMSGMRIKVLDFGIAKLKDRAVTNLTQTGSVMGTPHYMSPEQCLGEELDHRSDIYSLGIVAYEMLTGRVPFNSPTSTAVVIQHVNHPPPPLHLIRSDITPAMESVVLHALEKRRELRPQSAGALANEFTAAVNGVPTMQQARATFEHPATPVQTAEPTLVLRNPPAPQYISGPVPPAQTITGGQPPPSNTTRTVLLTAIVTILLVSLAGSIVWLASTDGSADKRGDTRGNTNNRNQSNARANNNDNGASSTPTPSVNTNMTVATNANTAATPANNSASRSQVMAVMNRWADSLRQRNLYDNLSCYADYLDDFYYSGRIDKERVRASRQKSFAIYYSSVDVQLSDVQVSFDYSGSTATVAYDNTYDWRGGARYLTGKSHNEITLKQFGGQWLITSERHLQSYYENKN